MKFFKKMKDGGAESTVTGYWLIEWKKAFSIVLVKFDGKSREAYHEHAFNCWNWLLKGHLAESITEDPTTQKPGELRALRLKLYLPSWKPFFVGRDRFHKVDSLVPVSWVLSFRGPWADTWREYLPYEDRVCTLTHGRIEVD